MKFNKRSLITTLLSTFMWGILAHGMGLFNKFSFHDDAGMFYVGCTYESGRWMLGILDSICRKIFGSVVYSSPLFNGVFTILFIALINIILVDLFEIKNKFINIGLNGVMVVFPAITGIMGYVFTAPYYYFGTLLGILGIWLIFKFKKWYYIIIGILLMACSVGVYQSNIPVLIGVSLLLLIKMFYDDSTITITKQFKIIGQFIVTCIGFMIIYFAINSLMLKIKGIQLLDYKGISSFGQTSIIGYLKRIIIAYKEFINPTNDVLSNMYPYSIEKFYKISILITTIFTIYLFIKNFSKRVINGIIWMILVLAGPLAANFIYVMCEISTIHSLMMYGQVVYFIYFAWVIDKFEIKFEKANKIIKFASILLLLGINILWVRFDNICYLKAEFMQQRAINYFTTLITEIKSTEGYTDEMPVVYINEFNKTEESLTYNPQFSGINILPYRGDTLINNYNWRNFMKMWCGYSPNVIEQKNFIDLEEIDNIPCYPDDGSIVIIDDVIVVKFSN